DGGARRALVAEVELVELLALEVGEARLEGLARGGAELGLDSPVLAGAEGLDLGLALADEAQRHRLDAASRAAAWQLAPRHRREGEADQVVEGAAGEIGLDQLAVELPRAAEGVEDSVLRHLVKDDALDVDPFEGPAALQLLAHVPGDRLALAVGVGGEEEPGRALHRLGDLLEALRALA